MGVYEGSGACKSLAVSYNTEYVVGAFATEGFEIFNAWNGQSLRKVSGKERCMNIDFNLGDTELSTVLLGFAKNFVNTYDFQALLNSESPVLPKCSIEFREETPS